MHVPKRNLIHSFFFPFVCSSICGFFLGHSVIHTFTHPSTGLQIVYNTYAPVLSVCTNLAVMFSFFFSPLRCRWMCLLWFQRWVSVASVSSDYYNSNNDRHTVAKGWKNCLTLYRSVIIVFFCTWNASGPSNIFPEFTLPAGCDQDCDNTPGNYSCSCERGFQLQSDGKSCTGEKHEKYWLTIIG